MINNRVMYAITVFMAVAFAVFSEHRAAYTVLYTVLMLPVFSWLLMRYAKYKISVEEFLDSSIIKKGETVRYIIKFSSLSLFFGVKTEVVLTPLEGVNFLGTRTLFLSPRSFGKIELEIEALYRGMYTINPKIIWIYDMMGFFRESLKKPKRLTLTVLPNVQVLEALPVSRNNAESKNTGIRGMDDSDAMELTKYLISEGHKRIHWPLSAARGELIAKNFYEPVQAAAAVVIDNSKCGIVCEDRLMEAAVSVAAYCVRAGIPVYLYYMGQRSMVSPYEFDVLYASTTEILFNRGENFPSFLARTAQMRGVSDYFIFTQDVSRTLLDCVKGIHADRNGVVVFHYAEDNETSDSFAAELYMAGAECFRLSRDVSVSLKTN